MTLENAPTVIALALTAAAFLLQAPDPNQFVHAPAVTWPKAAVRTAGSEGRVQFYAAHHR